MRKPRNEEFGARVRSVLGKMSLRAADAKTGVNHVTISDMSVGQIPSMESVIKFAQGFGLDIDEWLDLADYPTVGGGAARETLNAAEVLYEGWQRIRRAHPEQVIEFPLMEGGFSGLTVEKAQGILLSIEKRAERAGYPKRPAE